MDGEGVAALDGCSIVDVFVSNESSVVLAGSTAAAAAAAARAFTAATAEAAASCEAF